ncbi:hypothetical protein T484DRAFT_1898680 [Baffinella frigidus]|nr:hypothetical protein T484DRAFT_1898680 [Cryptophyta sp. CCMP2293]
MAAPPVTWKGCTGGREPADDGGKRRKAATREEESAHESKLRRCRNFRGEGLLRANRQRRWRGEPGSGSGAQEVQRSPQDEKGEERRSRAERESGWAAQTTRRVLHRLPRPAPDEKGEEMMGATGRSRSATANRG